MRVVLATLVAAALLAWVFVARSGAAPAGIDRLDPSERVSATTGVEVSVPAESTGERVPIEPAAEDSGMHVLEVRALVRHREPYTMPGGKSESHPLEGARVEFSIVRPSARFLIPEVVVPRRPYGEGVTDAEGNVTARFPITDADWRRHLDGVANPDRRGSFRDRLSVVVTAQAEGHRPTQASSVLRADLSRPIVQRLSLFAGDSLLVSVRHEGEPVNATVDAIERTSEGKWRSIGRAERVLDEPGRFRLDLRRSYAERAGLALVARADGVGTARMDDLDFAAIDMSRPIEMELEGEGVIAGRLVDPAGAGLVKSHVRAVPARLLGTLRIDDPERYASIDSRGCIDGRAEVAADGRFTIRGLAPGRYRLVEHDRLETKGRSVLAESVMTNSPPATYVVARHTIIVRATDESGARVKLSCPDKITKVPSQGSVLAYCRRVDTVDGIPFSPWLGYGSTTLVARVEPGVDYAVGIVSTRYGVKERVVRLAESEYVREIDLVLEERGEPGAIEVTAADPEGEPVARALLRVMKHEGPELFRAHWSARRVSPVTAKALRVELAAGTYDLEVIEQSYSRVSRFAPVRRTVVVRAGVTTPVDVCVGEPR